MSEYKNPPCNISAATSCVYFSMTSSSEEGRAAAPFKEGVSSSAWGELAIHENASTVSLAPNSCVLPDLSVAVREGDECVCDFLDHVSGEENVRSRHFLGGKADNDDSFVEKLSGITAVGDAVGVLDICRCVGTCKFIHGDMSRGCCRRVSFAYLLVFFLLFSLVFLCRNITVAIRIFHKLVSSARLLLNKAAWGYCVLVFD